MGFTLNNAAETLQVLTEADINLVLSGHIHIQDIRSENQVYDIATGAFEVYPHRFGVIGYSPETGEAEYNTEPVDVEGWAEATGSDNADLLDFNAFSADFFYDMGYSKAIKRLAEQNYTEAEQQSMAEAMAKVNMHYFAGTSGAIDQELLNSKGIALWKDAKEQFMKSYVLSMLKEPKENNHLEVELGKRQQ